VVDQEVTRLLRNWRDGDDSAFEHLMPMVYGQLRSIAARAFNGERADHTLQPTALVNEAMQRLIGADVDYQDRNHFFALSARLMRRILVDHAKARNSARRGSGALKITIQDSHAPTDADVGADLLSLEDALSELARFDSRKAEVVELHYFGGLTYNELAEFMQIAESTVHEDLRTAKAWLQQRMAG
jgi:RNA polymerase sigma factor (TIGR02999 family)